MTKTKKLICVAAILLAILLAFVGGQTFSKYISQVQGSGVANIAKWSFKVNGEKAQIGTINLTDTINEKTLTNGKIAPGTSGAFDIIIDSSESEVGTNHKIIFENEQNKPQNLKFVYEDKQYDSLKSLEEKLQDTIDVNSENKIKAYTIFWNWNYETQPNISTSDIQDTSDANNFNDYTFNIKVIGTQVIPQK